MYMLYLQCWLNKNGFNVEDLNFKTLGKLT